MLFKRKNSFKIQLTLIKWWKSAILKNWLPLSLPWSTLGDPWWLYHLTEAVKTSNKSYSENINKQKIKWKDFHLKYIFIYSFNVWNFAEKLPVLTQWEMFLSKLIIKFDCKSGFNFEFSFHQIHESFIRFCPIDDLKAFVKTFQINMNSILIFSETFSPVFALFPMLSSNAFWLVRMPFHQIFYLFRYRLTAKQKLLLL